MKMRKILIFLFSLLAASLFWIYVVTTVAPNSTGSVGGIKVSLIGDTTLEARNLMITSYGTQTVRVDLEASRATLSKLNSNNMQAYLDVSRITEAGEYDLSYSVSFPDTVNSGEISILRKSVDTIHITVSEVVSKTLRVEMQWSGQVREDCLFDAGKVEFDPDTITLKGPADEVNTVASAVVYYDVTDLAETTVLREPVIFLDELGNELEISEITTVSATEIETTVPILRLKDIALTVDLRYGAGMNSDNVSVTLSEESIRVSGEADVIEAMSDTLTLETVDLSEVEDGEVLEFQLGLPSGVENITGDTVVTATIKFTGLEYKSYTVSDIQLINEPEGYEITLSTRAANVRLRGSASIFREITAANIHITVDLNGYTQSGTYTVRGVVTIDGDPDVGVLGNVDVIITLS